MRDEYRQKSILRVAQRALGPTLKERGYRRSTASASWQRQTEVGQLGFSLHGMSSGWTVEFGSRFSFRFECEPGLRYGGMNVFSLLPGPRQQDWLAQTARVLERALQPDPDDPDLDDETLQARADLKRELLAEDLPYLDSIGWPWFTLLDVHEWLALVRRDLAAAEQAAVHRIRTDPVPPPVWYEGADVDEPDPDDPFSGPLIIAAREDIAEQLWRYGEDELAIAMLDADDDGWHRVMGVAGQGPRALAQASNVMIDTSLAQAAVQVLTGTDRPLRRRRRRPQTGLAGWWQRVGPERDRRDPDSPFGLPVEEIVDLTLRGVEGHPRAPAGATPIASTVLRPSPSTTSCGAASAQWPPETIRW